MDQDRGELMPFGRARRSRRREEGAQDSAADEGGVRQERQSVRQKGAYTAT